MECVPQLNLPTADARLNNAGARQKPGKNGPAQVQPYQPEGWIRG